MSLSQKKRIRKRFSEEEKQRMSIAQIGRFVSEETKRKQNKAKGIPVICTKTNIEYESIKQASESIGINTKVLQQMLRGEYRNKTTIIYKRDWRGNEK